MTGIDVSENNGKIDWALVKQTTNFKVDFAYIKTCEGIGYNDKNRAVNANEAKSNGIKIGYYHFASINSLDVVKDSTAEANYFLQSLSGLPVGDLPPVLDIEKNECYKNSVGATVTRKEATNADGTLKPSFKKQPLLTQQQMLLWINTFFNIIKKTYPNYVLYSYTPFLNEHLPTNHGLENVPLWIAAYNNLAAPKLPNGWQKCWLWQNSCTGKINGIHGNVDLNKQI